MASGALRVTAALFSGLVFGLGLAVSGMMDPAKVIGFLDVAGDWDPTLAFVMGGALLVAVPAYRYIPRRRRPVLEEGFSLPKANAIDGPLISGSVLFGVRLGSRRVLPRACGRRAQHRVSISLRLLRGDASGDGTLQLANGILIVRRAA